MNSMTDPTNCRCFNTDPHAPHRTVFAPEVGIANIDCPGIPMAAGPTVHYTHEDLAEAFRSGVVFGQSAVVGRAPGYAEGYLAATRAQESQIRHGVTDCPEWCTADHTGDDPADPIDNLILHTDDDHTDGTLRTLLDALEDRGSKLDIRVARCDCPQEGRVGVPSLMVRADVELTTWEQAAELARTILDAFGYLKGADQP